MKPILDLNRVLDVDCLVLGRRETRSKSKTKSNKSKRIHFPWLNFLAKQQLTVRIDRESGPEAARALPSPP